MAEIIVTHYSNATYMPNSKTTSLKFQARPGLETNIFVLLSTLLTFEHLSDYAGTQRAANVSERARDH